MTVSLFVFFQHLNNSESSTQGHVLWWTTENNSISLYSYRVKVNVCSKEKKWKNTYCRFEKLNIRNIFLCGLKINTLKKDRQTDIDNIIVRRVWQHALINIFKSIHFDCLFFSLYKIQIGQSIYPINIWGYYFLHLNSNYSYRFFSQIRVFLRIIVRCWTNQLSQTGADDCQRQL